MTLLAAALLGIVQGVTEFLPVSSTAHLLLVRQAIGFEDPGGVFTAMIQLGSILAVAWVYRVKLFNMMTGLATRPEARHFAAAIVVATIPALIAGALFAGYVKRILYQSPRVWAIAFIVGGVLGAAAPIAMAAEPCREGHGYADHQAGQHQQSKKAEHDKSSRQGACFQCCCVGICTPVPNVTGALTSEPVTVTLATYWDTARFGAGRSIRPEHGPPRPLA